MRFVMEMQLLFTRQQSFSHVKILNLSLMGVENIVGKELFFTSTMFSKAFFTGIVSIQDCTVKVKLICCIANVVSMTFHVDG